MTKNEKGSGDQKKKKEKEESRRRRKDRWLSSTHDMKEAV